MKYIVLLALLFFTLFAQDKELEKVSLQLHWKYQFQFAGFIAAKEKGFYEEVGLDVELKEYKYGIDIVKDVLNNRSNYAIYNSNILIEYLNNKSIKILSSYFKRSALVLLTKENIKSPKDLVGKTIMAMGEEDFLINFKSVLDEYDINISDINLVEHTYNIKDFENVDAMTAYISDQPYKLTKLGIKYNTINPSDLGFFNLQLELFTSNNEILNHPRRTQAFRTASKKGWEYALSHKQEMIDLIHSKYAQNISLDELKNEAIEIEKLILPRTYDLGSIDKNFLKKQLEVFKFFYQITDEIALDDFLYDSSKVESLNLNIEEMKYLNTLSNITVCLGTNILPIDGFINKKHVGIMADVFKIISDKTGMKIKAIQSKSQKDLLKKIKNRECQLVSTVETEDMNIQNLVVSKPFYKTHFALISKIDKSFVSDFELLKDEVLIVSSEVYKSRLLKLYPFLNIIVEHDRTLMMKKVLDGESYGAITINETADYLIEQHGYGTLKINGFLAKDSLMNISIGVQDSEECLLNIINKSLNIISEEKIDTIVKNWRITRYNDKTDYYLVLKILIIASILLLVMAYYQRKLKIFNATLEEQVALKTVELRKLNEALEHTVEEKVEELIKKDKILTIQSKQAVMGEMISMIAHQWRQPLAGITLQISNIEIDKMFGKEIDDKRIDTTLRNISDSILYLSETIDDFQTYFRPDGKPVDITTEELLDKVLTLATAKIETSKVDIRVHCSSEQTISIYVNELVQVVLNILNNAIDAFDDVQRDEQIVDIYGTIKNDMIHLSIKDNASGISDENIKKLFDPYFSTKGRNGTGLGLYMSQMIIQKQFRGTIDVESSEEGSVFIIKIPIVLD